MNCTYYTSDKQQCLKFENLLQPFYDMCTDLAIRSLMYMNHHMHIRSDPVMYFCVFTLLKQVATECEQGSIIMYSNCDCMHVVTCLFKHRNLL